MRGLRERWVEPVRSLGRAFLGLLQAEVGALRADLAASGRRLRAGVSMLLAAAVFILLAVVGAIVAAYEALALVWPRWAAALAIASGALAVGALLAWLGRRRLQTVESPRRLLERHAQEHRAWWQETFGEGGEVGTEDGG